MRITLRNFFFFLSGLLLTTPLLAQGGATSSTTTLKIGAIAMGIASGLCGIGQGMATKGACEGLARNPGAVNNIRFVFIFGLVLIESLALYVFALAFLGY